MVKLEFARLSEKVIKFTYEDGGEFYIELEGDIIGKAKMVAKTKRPQMYLAIEDEIKP